MSGLLRLVSEFIERMMNPAFGPLVNEDYSMRLGELLDDSESIERLLAEARHLSRVDELSAYTWVWLLTMPGAEVELDPTLLRELCQQFQAPAFRVTVIDCAMRGLPRLEPGEELDFDQATTLTDIKNRWLAELVRSAVRVQALELPDEASTAEPQQVGDPSAYHDAESLLVALLTVDRRECREAAAALLRHEWAGQQTLLTFFESRTTAMDEESRSRWLRLMPRA